MDSMPKSINVFDPHTGSLDKETRHAWRANRRVAYWLAYEEREGKMHPAGTTKEGKALLKAFTEKVTPPRGMDYNDFGQLWDLHPEHPFTPVLRERTIDDEWEEAKESFPKLPITSV